MPWRFGLVISGLFLFSGATALVYQVAWTRNLSLIFGASHQASLASRFSDQHAGGASAKRCLLPGEILKSATGEADAEKLTAYEAGPAHGSARDR